MSNVAICDISVARNISFNSVKSFRDTKFCRKFKFQGVQTESRKEFCLLR